MISEYSYRADASTIEDLQLYLYQRIMDSKMPIAKKSELLEICGFGRIGGDGSSGTMASNMMDNML